MRGAAVATAHLVVEVLVVRRGLKLLKLYQLVHQLTNDRKLCKREIPFPALLDQYRRPTVSCIRVHERSQLYQEQIFCSYDTNKYSQPA